MLINENDSAPYFVASRQPYKKFIPLSVIIAEDNMSLKFVVALAYSLINH